MLEASRIEATYVVINAHDLLEGSHFGECAVAWLRTRMKPGVVLLGSWPVLQAPEAPAIKASVHEFAMPWAAAHFTPRYLHALLRETGFEGAEVLWEVGESPIMERRDDIERITRGRRIITTASRGDSCELLRPGKIQAPRTSHVPQNQRYVSRRLPGVDIVSSLRCVCR